MAGSALKKRITPPFGFARWLSFRMHPVNWMTIGVGTVALGAFFLPAASTSAYASYTEQIVHTVPAMLFVLFGLFLAVYTECLYRIAYDEDAIYMRPPWFTWKLRPKPFVRLPFDHIGLVIGERTPTNELFYGRNSFTPFQHVSVYPHTWPDDWSGDQVFRERPLNPT